MDNFRTGTTPTGYPILNINDLKIHHPDVNIFISVVKEKRKVQQQLLDMGFKEKQIFTDIDFLWAQCELPDFQVYLNGYEWAYNYFTDDISKSIVIKRIERYLFGEPLEKTTEDIEYFKKDIIKLTDDEIFIDGGCFTGDTIDEFLKQINGKFNHIYSFEPDNNNYLKAAASFKDHKNIELINKGLWSHETELQFHVFNSGRNSFLADHVYSKNIVTVPVTSLDSVFIDRQKSEYPTFIKLDIEGSELEALKGAKKIIRENHPKMAICAYHKPEDIYELPQLINDFDKNYKLQLVQHRDDVNETVLYAV